MSPISGKRDIEVARYPLTELEQDALNHTEKKENRQ